MTTADSEPKKRRSRAELEELMLEAGLELMAAQKRNIDTDALNYKSVFDHLETTRDIRVTHASVHERIWSSQRAYQLDVLRRAAEGLPAATFLSKGAAAGVVASADVNSNEGRRFATREMIRVACNGDISNSDITLTVYRSIRMVLAGLEESDPEYPGIAQSIEESRLEIGARYVELFQRLAAGLRLRPKPSLNTDLDTVLYRLFAQVVALADGFAIDGPNENRMNLPTGLDGEIQDWHLYSWSVWSAAQAMLELDGDMPDHERNL